MLRSARFHLCLRHGAGRQFSWLEIGSVKAVLPSPTYQYPEGAYRQGASRTHTVSWLNLFNQASHMEVPLSEQVTIELLKGFLEAFNRHDLDAIMGYLAEDCIFYPFLAVSINPVLATFYVGNR